MNDSWSGRDLLSPGASHWANVTGLLTNDAEGRLKVKDEKKMTSRLMENGYTKKRGVPVFHFPYPDGTGFRDNPRRSTTDHKRNEATDKGESASNLKLYK